MWNMAKSILLPLKIEHVIDDRPAMKGGVLDGDILQKIDECDISDIYSYMECLSQLKPSQVISLQVLRENKVVILEVEL